MRVLLPLPDRDFDVTEVAVPWAILREADPAAALSAASGIEWLYMACHVIIMASHIFWRR